MKAAGHVQQRHGHEFLYLVKLIWTRKEQGTHTMENNLAFAAWRKILNQQLQNTKKNQERKNNAFPSLMSILNNKVDGKTNDSNAITAIKDTKSPCKTQNDAKLQQRTNGVLSILTKNKIDSGQKPLAPEKHEKVPSPTRGSFQNVATSPMGKSFPNSLASPRRRLGGIDQQQVLLATITVAQENASQQNTEQKKKKKIRRLKSSMTQNE